MIQKVNQNFMRNLMSESIDKERLNHTPVVIGNFAPFRLFIREGDTWKPTLEEINSNTYDYVKLARLTRFLDVGIAPFSMAVGFDVSLVLPAMEKFRSREAALSLFNKVLGTLLLGGLYSEAVHPMDISYGMLHFDGYLKIHGGGDGGIATFHKSIRTKSVGIDGAISLLDPTIVTKEFLEQAYKTGASFFKTLDGFSPNLLLNASSNFVKHQWEEALIFTWTSIEQLVNIIWSKKIIDRPVDADDIIEGRTSFLKDFRTWSTSTKIEVLFQNGLIDKNLYRLLNIARKTRNDFIHIAKPVGEEKARNSLEVMFRLLSLIVSEFQDNLLLSNIYEMILKNQRGELYPKKTSFEKEAVRYWRSIPPLPGDVGWKGDYAIIEELVLKRLDTSS